MSRQYDVTLEDDRGQQFTLVGYGNTRKVARRSALAKASRDMPGRSWRFVRIAFRRQP
jgi:hypothetical protein